MSPKRARAASGATRKKTRKKTAQPFGGPVNWDRGSPILEVAANRTFESVLRRIRDEGVVWVVVVRPQQGGDDVYYYAFRSWELEQLAADHPERGDWPIELAMDMREWKSSGTARGGRPLGPAVGNYGPASIRIVEFDAAGRVATVGELKDMLGHRRLPWTETPAGAVFRLPRTEVPARGCRGCGIGGSRGDTDAQDLDLSFDLGPMRGGGGEAETPAPAAEIEVTLSAETKAEIDVGTSARVPFQLELTDEAMPLEVSQPARAKKDVPIVVSLSAENDAIEIVRSHEFTVDPPGPGQPRTGFFTVKGVHEGVCRLAVAFRQGGSELGVIGLALEVVTAGAGKEKAKGDAVAAPRDAADDDKLALLIEQRVEGNQVFYEYKLHSEALGLPYSRVRSKPLLDRGGGPAATALAFVERIYERVT